MAFFNARFSKSETVKLKVKSHGAPLRSVLIGRCPEYFERKKASLMRLCVVSQKAIMKFVVDSTGAIYRQVFSENSVGTKVEEPLHTVMAGAPRFGLVTPHITVRNGSIGTAIDEPIRPYDLCWRRASTPWNNCAMGL